MTTRQQHYVWRKHLDAWEICAGQLYVLRKGKIFKSSSKKIMKQRDFYSLPSITDSDVKFLEDLLSDTSQNLLRSHQNLIRYFQIIAIANNTNRFLRELTQKDRKVIRDFSIEAEEKLQTQVEQEALPILENLRQENTTFLSDDDSAINFFRFLSHQYLRTKKLRDKLRAMLNKAPSGQDRGHLVNIYCLCIAENVACSLFVDRADFEVIFLRTVTECQFITGDQPIVNLFLSVDKHTPPDELIFYFPLGPLLSMLLLPKGYRLTSLDATPKIVNLLNNYIAFNSKESLVAKCKNTLCESKSSLSSVYQHNGHQLIEEIRNQASL